MTELKQIRDGINPLGKARYAEICDSQIKDGVYNEHHVAKLKTPDQYKNAVTKYIDAIMENLDQR